MRLLRPFLTNEDTDMKKYQVLSAGLMVSDIIARPVSSDLFSKDTVYPDSITFHSGGDALNVAVDLSKLGASVAMAGCVGDDAAGQFLINILHKEGIDSSCVRALTDNGTATSLVICEPNAERHFIFRAGANTVFDGSSITDEMLSSVVALFIGSSMALPSLEGDVLAALFKRARNLGVITAMDATTAADGRYLERIEAALPYTDIFIPSHGEALNITGEDDPEAEIAFLKNRGVRVAGVKSGSKGVFISSDKLTHIAADTCPCPVDTTGAGDAFMAGFLYGIVNGKTPEQSAVIGNKTAYCCIMQVGAALKEKTIISLD